MPDPQFDGLPAKLAVHRVQPAYPNGRCPGQATRAAVLIHGRTLTGPVVFDLRQPAPEGGTLSTQEALARAGIDTFAPSLLGYGQSTTFATGLDDPGNASRPGSAGGRVGRGCGPTTERSRALADVLQLRLEHRRRGSADHSDAGDAVYRRRRVARWDSERTLPLRGTADVDDEQGAGGVGMCQPRHGGRGLFRSALHTGFGDALRRSARSALGRPPCHAHSGTDRVDPEWDVQCCRERTLFGRRQRSGQQTGSFLIPTTETVRDRV
jgi:hypothetical protein